MASITLKDLPADLYAQLKLEAEANFRSLAQVLARLHRSFEVDAALKTKATNDSLTKRSPAVPKSL